MSDQRDAPSILLLEDEPLIAMGMQQILEELGYDDVDIFYRLEPAEEAIGERQYEIAFLDVNIGQNQTSIDLAKQLSSKGTAVIFASGNSHSAKVFGEVARGVIDKPYKKTDIRTVLESL
jgi:DNA-binding NtrC family response regulator